MLPTKLNEQNLKNKKQVAKRISQLLSITENRLELPDGHWTKISSSIDINSGLTWANYFSISFGDDLGKHRFSGEIRLFTNGESSKRGCRAKGMLFMRWGKNDNFCSEDLLFNREERFAYEKSLSAVLRSMTALTNKVVKEHAESHGTQNTIA
ncbi:MULTISPECIES: hypothetical protein [Vibrio]|uniref:Uncharacterized protein n=2 Tax=Vibrio TaxID=662 RepID=A0A510IFD9_9VIBR|nr:MULTISPECIES: hypothetical protein [Vibrio]RTZ24935.1 hypothetical protein EKN09_01295 [Vibrio penaeicida]BBL92433.1 hypothetical protein VroAM7_50860 [Vibrio rotiferianus]GLQ71181.1 hypothetical protein GCM10007932_05410 [Vibrio penaeicida]